MTIEEIVKEIDRRVLSAEVGDMEDLGYFVREHWKHVRKERSALRESLCWALNLLDIYDKRLAQIDGEDRVYTPVHIDGKALARKRLGGPQRLRATAEAGRVCVCRVCGCRWKLHADGTYQLYDADQRPERCCDNGPFPPLDVEVQLPGVDVDIHGPHCEKDDE